MGLADKLHHVEKKYALPFLGFVLAIIFGGITIYTEFIQEKNPYLKFIISSSGVFSVHDDMARLDILLNGVNIREKKETLSLIILDVLNSGGASILKGSYDEHEPLGLEIRNGSVVKAEIVKTTSDYLSRNVRELNISTNRILFAPVIIEPNEGFSAKILVLHDEGVMPNLVALGKVASVRKIEMVQASQLPPEPPFWKRVVAGNILVHLARAAAYAVVLIAIVLLIVVPASFLSDRNAKRKRERAVDDFQKFSGIDTNPKSIFTFSKYVDNGAWYVSDLNNLLRWPKQLLPSIRKIHSAPVESDPEWEVMDQYSPRRHKHRMALDLLRSGFVKYEDGKLTIDEEMQRILGMFVAFLKSRGLLEDDRALDVEVVENPTNPFP